MHQFTASLEIIVGNPFVFVPSNILHALFQQAHKDKGPIPIRGTVNGKPYQQTLVRYSGDWRLYINMNMLKDSPRRIGEQIQVEVEFDPSDRTIKPHPDFSKALADNEVARAAFERLTPSRQKEILRYISGLKTQKSIDKNVKRAIEFLSGHGKFVGRDSLE